MAISSPARERRLFTALRVCNLFDSGLPLVRFHSLMDLSRPLASVERKAPPAESRRRWVTGAVWPSSIHLQAPGREKLGVM